MNSSGATRLVALDIDGTLIAPGVPHTALPDAPMTKVIGDLIDAGVTIVLATGRMFPGTLRIARHLGVTQPLICQQGAATLTHDGRDLRRCLIDPHIALEVADFAEEAGWPYAWFDSKRYLVSEANHASQYFADVSGVSVEVHKSPKTADVEAVGIDIISSRDAAGAIHEQLQQRYGDRVQLLDFGLVTAVHGADASKGRALAALAADLGIEATEVLAVGDSANDASMLRWAGHGAAPEHCDRYARDAADAVLAGSGVDGVVELLQELLDAHQRR